MNLNKSFDFFNPTTVERPIHIIGCGSVGSTIAENLARCGIENFVLWDFDTVSDHNVSNQMFTEKQIGMKKVDALAEIIKDINSSILDENIEKNDEGWDGDVLSGYIFLAVDSIDLRREIVKQNLDNEYIDAIFDVRTMLESAVAYAADWSNEKMKKSLLNTMNFTDAEANAENAVSACGVTLGVATTVRIISAFVVNNFLNFVKGRGIKKFIQADCFDIETMSC